VCAIVVFIRNSGTDEEYEHDKVYRFDYPDQSSLQAMQVSCFASLTTLWCVLISTQSVSIIITFQCTYLWLNNNWACIKRNLGMKETRLQQETSTIQSTCTERNPPETQNISILRGSIIDRFNIILRCGIPVVC